MSRSVWVGAAIALAAAAGGDDRAVAACRAPVGARPVWTTLPQTPPLPQPERQGSVAVAGSRIWYGEYGVDRGGVPVLLLHGGLASSAYFGHLIPALVKAGHHVVAVDSRGHGRSAASSLPYSYGLMADDVRAVLDALHIAGADIVGWSDGGTIGYVLAIAHPDRVRRLFAFGANARLDGLKPGYADVPTFAAYLARTRRTYRPGAAYDGFVRAISRMWDTEPDIPDARLRTIRVPVTIAVAEHDEALKIDHARALASAIPRGRLIVLPGVSHFAMLQCPREFDASVLRFLRSRE